MNASNLNTITRLEACLAAPYDNRALRRRTQALLRHVRKRPSLAAAIVAHERNRFPLTVAALEGRRVYSSSGRAFEHPRVQDAPAPGLWSKLRALVLGALSRKPAGAR